MESAEVSRRFGGQATDAHTALLRVPYFRAGRLGLHGSNRAQRGRMIGPEPKQIAGGPAQHAGNLFHYLYAATRAMELLQEERGVLSVRLEGLGGGAAEEDALDVVVERDNAVEFIQIKWSSG